MKVITNGLVPIKEESWQEHPVYLAAKARRGGFSYIEQLRAYQYIYNATRTQMDILQQQAILTISSLSDNPLNQL